MNFHFIGTRFYHCQLMKLLIECQQKCQVFYSLDLKPINFHQPSCLLKNVRELLRKISNQLPIIFNQTNHSLQKYALQETMKLPLQNLEIGQKMMLWETENEKTFSFGR